MGARREVTQASLQDTFLRARKRMKILILLSVKFSVDMLGVFTFCDECFGLHGA